MKCLARPGILSLQIVLILVVCYVGMVKSMSDWTMSSFRFDDGFEAYRNYLHSAGNGEFYLSIESGSKNGLLKVRKDLTVEWYSGVDSIETDVTANSNGVAVSDDGEFVYLGGFMWKLVPTDYRPFVAVFFKNGTFYRSYKYDFLNPYDTKRQYIYDVHQVDDHIYLCGYTQTASGDDKLLILKIHLNGTVAACFSYGNSFHVRVKRMIVDSSSITVIGFRESIARLFFMTVDSTTGNIMSTIMYTSPVSIRGNQIKKLSDNGYLVFGRDNSAHYGYILRVDSIGDPIWSKQLHHISQGSVASVVIGNNGFYYAFIRTNYSTGAIYCFNPTNGNLEWAVQSKATSGADIQGLGVTNDGSNEIFLVGEVDEETIYGRFKESVNANDFCNDSFVSFNPVITDVTFVRDGSPTVLTFEDLYDYVSFYIQPPAEIIGTKLVSGVISECYQCHSVFHDPNCNVTDCHGVWSNETSKVCNGHGKCSYQNNCTCDVNYSGTECNDFECMGIPKDSRIGCYNNGNCTGHDICSCDDGWGGNANCSVPICNGKIPSEPNVCNGNGICVSAEECNCTRFYGGIYCDRIICSADGESESNYCKEIKEMVEVECNNDVTGNDVICTCLDGYCGDLCDSKCSESNIWYEIAGNFLLDNLPYSIGGASGLLVLCLCPIWCPCLVLLLILIFGILLVVSLVCLCVICVPCLFVICLPCVICLILGLGFTAGRVGKGERDVEGELNKIRRKSTKEASLNINQDLFEIKYDDIKVKEIIGEGGSSAVVYLASWRGTEVAFKCFKIAAYLEQSKFEEFEREAEMMISVNHPNILGCYGCTIHIPRVGIVMEYCINGDLRQYLSSKKGKRMGVFGRLRILHGVALALEYLHNRKIIHRDLKCGNVLLTDSLVPKVMDFGASRIYESIEQTKTKQVGTSIYMAPEIVLGDKYSDPCDVFSFSIMVWEVMLNDFEPYDEPYAVEIKVANNPSYRPALKGIGKKKEFPKWMRKLCKKCWDHDPDVRYSFSRIVEIFEENKGKGMVSSKKKTKTKRKKGKKGKRKKEKQQVEEIESDEKEEEQEQEQEEVDEEKEETPKDKSEDEDESEEEEVEDLFVGIGVSDDESENSD